MNMVRSASAFWHFPPALTAQFSRRFSQVLGRRCIYCSKANAMPLCEVCYKTIALPKYRCRVCGIAMTAQPAGACCRTCLEKPPAFQVLLTAGNYEGVLADCIVRGKVTLQPAAIEALRYIQRRKLSQLQAQSFHDYTVVAMPTPKWRLMQRGFNLPDLLAADMGQLWGLPKLHSQVIQLPFNTQKQALKSGKQRKKYQPLYQISDNIPAKIIIIDDIVTTGRSVDCLARVLRQYGAQTVAVWALARTQLT